MPSFLILVSSGLSYLCLCFCWIFPSVADLGFLLQNLLGSNYVASCKNETRDANTVFWGEFYKNMVFALLCQSAELASLEVCLGQWSVPVVPIGSHPSTAAHLTEL